jgi:hypothetical protein
MSVAEGSLFDATLLAEQEMDEHRESRWPWHPSSAGYCPRRQWMEAKGYPRTSPVDTHALRMFFAGKAFHLAYRMMTDLQGRRITPTGQLCRACSEPLGAGRHGKEEFHLVSERDRVSGYLDILVAGFEHVLNGHLDYPIEKVTYIRGSLRSGEQPQTKALEVKSTEARQFFYARKRPQDSWMYQLSWNFLMWAANPNQLPVEPEVWAVVVLCRGKDMKTNEVPEALEIPLTPEWVERGQERLALLNSAWEKDSPPECLCWVGMGGKEFRYCAYATGRTGECCVLEAA